MPYPQEYQLASKEFSDFLGDVKIIAYFGSRHMAYTMVQGVFQVFRRRLDIKDAIKFANVLPVGLRALFISDWDTEEERKSFVDHELMTEEAKQLRPNHNYSTDTAINDVAKALRRHVDEDLLDETLRGFPEGAIEFWRVS
jgi:uncharacterized protein (DUF2267 family)